MFITTNEVLIDWFTLTTFDREVMYELSDYLETMDGMGQQKASKIMQYSGTMIKSDAGTIFLGQAYQRGTRHYMMRASGEIADYYFPAVYDFIRSGRAKITRIDLQATIEEPGGWSQWKLFNRMKKQGKNMGWVESKAKRKGRQELPLATVYVNSRKSDRFARVYEKLTDGWVKLLRLEVESKGDVAGAIARRLADSKPEMRQSVKVAEVLNFAQKDDKLHLAFADVLTGNLKPVKVKSSTGNTGRWLLETCFPAMVRYLNAHDANDRQAVIDQIAIIYDAYIGIDS